MKTTVAALCVAAVALSGCHSSKHRSAGRAVSAQVQRRVDAICTDATKATVPPPGDPTAATAAELPAWRDYLAISVPRLEATLDKWRAAVPAAQQTTDLRHVWSRFDAVDATGREAEEAAGRGDLAGFHRAVLSLEHNARLADADARAAGFGACGGA